VPKALHCAGVIDNFACPVQIAKRAKMVGCPPWVERKLLDLARHGISVGAE
jgi:hypothetical protein